MDFSNPETSSTPDKTSYSVTLNDTHQPSLTFISLNQLRRQQQLCDIELQIGDARFSAHQVILAASSPYLLKLISAKPSTVSHITLSDANLQIFAVDMLIEFLYTSTIKITQSTVQAICYAAKVLKLVRIERACCKFMLNCISEPNDALNYLLFAIPNGYTHLQQKCIKYLTKEIDALSNNKSFLLLSPDKLFHLLRLFDSTSKIDLLSIWANHDSQMRQQYLQALINGLEITVPDNCNPSLRQKTLKQVSSDLLQTSRHSKNIYVAGGNTDQAITVSVEMYNHETGSWQSVTNLPKKKSHSSLVACGGQLYLIGGFNGSRRVSSVDIFDPTTAEWVPGPSIKHTRSGSAAALFKGEIYIIGGYNGSKHLHHVEIFNPKKREWRDGPPLQQARSYVQAAVLDGALYAVGGADNNGRLSSVEKLSDAHEQWTSVAPLTLPRSRPGAVAIGSHLYVCGGYDGETHLSSVERFDPQAEEWTIVSNMSTPRNSPGVCAMGNNLYIFGGYNGRHFLKSMEVLDTATNSWSAGEPMITPRCDFGYASCLAIPFTNI